ncbi:unnamed protein product [Adineta steineri]|uniref:Uncharacterized protein n=3 Tax=Adineta steineri TaxID=433720 RepID=A0A819F732_9BILA|nr:unnamed protein product [Adineta steineri]
MAASAGQASNGANSFLDRYRSNLNTPRGGQTNNNNNNYAPPNNNYQQQQQQPRQVLTQQQNSQNYGPNVDTSVYRTQGNVFHDERAGNDILARAGPSHHYQRADYRTHEIISSDGRLDNLNVQMDHEPLRVVKPNEQNVHYKQQVNVRFLEPPPGPEPAPIIIKERHAPAPPAPPPLVIRQRPPTPPTPPPLIIRERPPTPPVQQQPQIIEKILPAPPAPPRQVIVERLPPPPPKPRQVIYEKWLPYEDTKERPVIVHRAPPQEVIKQPKNLIIEYEQAQAHHEQVIVDEGVFRADPKSHNSTSTPGEIRIVDKISDLPVNYSKYLTNRNTTSRSLPSSSSYDQQQGAQPQASQTGPAQQYRANTYSNPGAYQTTYRASYKNQTGNRNGLGQNSNNDVNQSANFAKYT